jgi:signal transduction histidine kinase/CheY-like chemotaxis protein
MLAVILPLLAVGLSAINAHDRHFGEARRRLSDVVGVMHEHAVKVLETHDLLAMQVNALLGDLPDDAVREREQVFHGHLASLADRLAQVQDIWVLNADGRPLATARVHPAPRDVDLSDRRYFRVHREGLLPADQSFVSEVLRGRIVDSRFFQLSKRRTGLLDASEAPFRGVTAISIEPRYFEEFYATLAQGGAFTSAALVREGGDVLARQPPTVVDRQADRLDTDGAFLAALRADQERGTYETTTDGGGGARLAAYRRIDGRPIYIAADIESETILAAWRADVAKQAAFAVPAALALLLLSLAALRIAEREQRLYRDLRAEGARRADAENQLRHAQKMEAIGRLTGGIAHDFNNLLTVVIGNLDRIRKAEVDDRVRRAAENARAGAMRAATLTQRLLAFSRRQPLQPEAVDANRLLAGMWDLLDRTIGESITIRVEPGESLWPTLADHHQLENAILNLCVNARDAMPEGGALTLSTRNEADLRMIEGVDEPVQPGDYVAIAVTDTGSGMTPDIAARAFDPFFTTKPMGQGTGLGLSQVYGFVRQSGGHASIRSTQGRGTTITLYLPRLAEGVVPAGREDASQRPRMKRVSGVTVLLAEDDLLVRRYASEILQEAGHRVLAAGDALGALDLLERHPDVGLMFSDLVMGAGMDGLALAAEARRRRPDLKIILTTGHGREATGEREWPADVGFLPKPYAAGELLDRIDGAFRLTEAA